MKPNHVAVGMSGGVDSSVCAALLLKDGYRVHGVTLQLQPDLPFAKSSCGSSSDADDAKKVAAELGIPFSVWDMRKEFSQQVIRRFSQSYQKADTPNPCIHCNRYIKFDAMIEKALEEGMDYVATGHYARVEYDNVSGRYLLKKAADPTKDQSYVLYSLTQEQLSHILFPLGELSKQQVRALAEEYNFHNAHKKESQDICFVPDGDYAAFIKKYSGVTFPEGDFVDKNGTVLGRHKGIIHYTVGQRKGLGLSFPCPMYVLEKNKETNTVVLGPLEELFQTTFYATDLNWISIETLTDERKVHARIRYNQKEQPATVRRVNETTVEVTFLEPQKAITRGQAVVFYDGDIVVGGGTIL